MPEALFARPDPSDTRIYLPRSAESRWNGIRSPLPISAIAYMHCIKASVRYIAFDLGAQNIRVNAISAGPVRTLAAAGIGDFRQILGWVENNSALNRNITLNDVGGAGVFLCSDLASGITGEIIHVDAGYNLNGMMSLKNAHKSAELLATFKKAEE